MTAKRPLTLGTLTLALSFVPLLFARPIQAQTENVLYNFTGGNDGGWPLWGLVSDHAGNLYGTTYGGGLGYGVVFELSPDGGGGWNETVLYSFTGGMDGANPSGPLIFDNAGNIYGEVSYGGASGYGAVFELTPAGNGWTEQVLHSFAGGTDGQFPTSGLLFDTEGNLYGETYNGWGLATVFQMSLSDGGWTEQAIYSVVTSGAGLTMDAAGNIFGANYSTVFELSPNGSGGWTPTVIHTFTGHPKDGYYAASGVVFDQAGNLYGTTAEGGRWYGGTIYKLSREKTGQWKEEILFSVRGGKGISALGQIVLDGAGNIYGTSEWGGRHDWGTVFEFAAPTGKGVYKQKILWNFIGTDGLNPLSVILDSAGNLYGVTNKGGATYADDYGYGVVFEVNP